MNGDTKKLEACGKLVIFDCGIFGLQAYGGVSGFVTSLIGEADRAGINYKLYYPKNLIFKGPLPTCGESSNIIKHDTLPARFSQYLPAPKIPDKAIWHSPYYRLPSNPRAKSIVTVHDFAYERFRSGLPRHLHQAIKYRSIRKAHRVVCISHATRDDLFRYLPDIDPKKVSVIPHGVDQTVYFPDLAPEFQFMQFDVLFLGQRTFYKRFDLAVEAIRLLPYLRLGIVGPNLTPEEANTLTDRLGDRWAFYGHVPDEVLRKMYSCAYAFIFPSDFEGFGLPVLEALSCKCLVISSKGGALGEFSEPGLMHAQNQSPECYATHLEGLRDNRLRHDAKAKIGTHGMSYTWSSAFIQYLNIYNSLAVEA